MFKKSNCLVMAVLLVFLALFALVPESAYSNGCVTDSPNFTGNMTLSGVSASHPAIQLWSTPNVTSGVSHGANIIFHYNRTNPQLYDTIGYLYWFIRNTNGNEFADMGEVKLMNISNVAGAEKARFIFAATWDGDLQTLAGWDWQNGLMIETPIRLASSGNSLHFRTDTEVAPNNTATPSAWVPVKLKDGSTGKIPVYK